MQSSLSVVRASFLNWFSNWRLSNLPLWSFRLYLTRLACYFAAMVLFHKTGGLVGGRITQHDNCFTIQLWSPQQIKCGSRDLLAVTWRLITSVKIKVQARNSSCDQRNVKLSLAGRQCHAGKGFWKCACPCAELRRCTFLNSVRLAAGVVICVVCWI